LAATFVLVLFFLMRQNQTTYSNSDLDINGNVKKGENRLGVPDRERKPRLSIETYQQPKTCYGCPGENGAGVSLTVSLNFLLCIC
jgi:hypothetical protein